MRRSTDGQESGIKGFPIEEEVKQSFLERDTFRELVHTIDYQGEHVGQN